MSVKLKETDGFMNIYLKDVVIFWEKLRVPGTKYESTEKEYSVTVILDKDDVRELKKQKVNKQFKEIGVDELGEAYQDYEGYFIMKLTSPLVNSKGNPSIIFVTSPDGDIPDDVIIGNGTKGNIRLMAWEGKGKAKGKLTVRPDALVVTDLVEGEAKGGSGGFDEELGVDLVKQEKTKAPDLSDFDDDDLPFDE